LPLNEEDDGKTLQ